MVAGLVLALPAAQARPPRASDPPKVSYTLGYDEVGGRVVKLTWGVDGSDDLLLMLECRKGAGRVELYDLSGYADRDGRITLTSAGKQTVIVGRLELLDGPGDSDVHAAAPASAAAFVGFRATGRITVSAQGGAYVISADKASLANVARFFAACGHGR
jgi:hypothetical protein